jgi:hypothetical protein
VKTIRVRFQWFDRDFDIRNNLLIDLLKTAQLDVKHIMSRSASCDIEFVGTHKPFSAKMSHRLASLKGVKFTEPLSEVDPLPSDYELNTSNFNRRIWYTNQNLRPPAQAGFDGSLSFDQDDFRGFNAYCPSWYGEIGIDWSKVSDLFNSDAVLGILKTGRKFNGSHQLKIGGFANHLNSLNSFAIAEFRKSNDVITFSSQDRRPLHKILRGNQEFKFILCPEIDYYPGYVTKILFEAYLAGAVPIYFGDVGEDQNINRAAFINAKDFPYISDLVSFVCELQPAAFNEIYEQPLLASTPSLSDVLSVIHG